MRWTSRSRAASCGLSCIIIVAAFAGFAPHPASAALFTLTDGNSIAQFDTATQANNFNWFVDGSDILAQQAFWYRIGNVSAEQSVHSLPIALQGTSDSNFDGNPDTLFVRYNGPGFRAETHYALNGGLAGSGAADITEQISISNLLDSPMDFHFFQYADFDLSATDTVLFSNANTVQQTGGTGRLTETVATPVPSHHEGAFFPLTLNELNDALPTTLSDIPPIGTPISGGDVTWAYEWDVNIPANSTFQISKDKHLSLAVPEPTAAGILLCTSAAFLTLRGRKKRPAN